MIFIFLFLTLYIKDVRPSLYPENISHLIMVYDIFNVLLKATITLIPKPNKDATKKRKLQANITDEHRCKNP